MMIRHVVPRATVEGAELPPTPSAEQIMAMPLLESGPWTREQVLELIEANPLDTPRYEVVDGQLLVTPSPRGPHQFAVRELLIALNAYLRRVGIGEVVTSPSDVEVERGTLTQPDVYVVPSAEAKRMRQESPVRELLLAIEIVSPSSARADRGVKRELYQRSIPEYWIVDLDSRLFERWRPGDNRPEILRDRVTWQPAGAREEFVLALPQFFRSLFGEA